MTPPSLSHSHSRVAPPTGQERPLPQRLEGESVTHYLLLCLLCKAACKRCFITPIIKIYSLLSSRKPSLPLLQGSRGSPGRSKAPPTTCLPPPVVGKATASQWDSTKVRARVHIRVFLGFFFLAGKCWCFKALQWSAKGKYDAHVSSLYDNNIFFIYLYIYLYLSISIYISIYIYIYIYIYLYIYISIYIYSRSVIDTAPLRFTIWLFFYLTSGQSKEEMGVWHDV